ncbi:extracellular polysaccharide biosynthesis protein [Salmonella enterica subsp. enterica]|uniref:Extracellular polysaccharide biosynthesis protein n=1 Tax=Salmonella enterica I TaxID=59201 RepID=A0A447N812_SALET|nr:extracellular polysaccharide biosynthesis protein [Salmonella enterica subsp. enterica]
MAGEMSAHHYFRDFAYCDSGMIPWLLVAELVCLKGQSLGELVRDRMAAFPASGEINSRLAEPAAAMARVEAHFAGRGAGSGPHGRSQHVVRQLAFQPALVKHRTGGAPECGITRRYSADGSANTHSAGAAESVTSDLPLPPAGKGPITGTTMTNLKKRERAKTNASLISMVQRFSDITIMFGGLWFICEVSGLPFLYMHLLVALITLVVFQMLGGMTDFYRSWRGVKMSTELTLLLQNWTLSLIFSAGLVAFNDDFDNRLATWLALVCAVQPGLSVMPFIYSFRRGLATQSWL